MANLPLEERPNPTAWRALLDRALPALDHVFAQVPDNPLEPHWTLGGGTAIALRIAHRLSDDVDIFVHGVSLRQLAPSHNPRAREIAPDFQWPGHYLKFHCDGGEIDFLSARLQTTPGFTLEKYRNRAIALETLDEVIVKKIRFRAAQFTSRDIFDLAAVGRHDNRLAKVLAAEVADALPRLRAVIEARRARQIAMSAEIRATPAFIDLLDRACDEALGVIDAASA